VLFSILLMLVPALLYFLPTILARQRKDLWKIFIINLLLAWTVIGWVVLFVWALGPKARSQDLNRTELSS
jgi:hypothetical protein